MTIPIIVFCNVMPCSSVDAYQDLSTLKIQEEDSSAIFISIYQTTKHHIPEDHISIHSNFLFICMLNSTARAYSRLSTKENKTTTETNTRTKHEQINKTVSSEVI